MKLPTGGGLGDMMQTLLNPEELTKEAPVDIFTASNVVSRNETVDGVATTHYRATEAQIRAMMAQNEAITQQKQTLLSGTADFWVARKGNYLKQYRTETLQEDETGRQVKSTMQIAGHPGKPAGDHRAAAGRPGDGDWAGSIRRRRSRRRPRNPLPPRPRPRWPRCPRRRRARSTNPASSPAG